MDGPPDWDLLAVVRSCTSSATTTTVSTPPPPPQQPPAVLLRYPTPFTTKTTSFSTGGWQELHEICQPTTYNNNNNNNNNNNMRNMSSMKSFSCISSSSPSPSSSLSHVIFGASSPTVASSNHGGVISHSQRAKKRKNLMKKVCHVPAEGLSSDMWAWRKYGQKPIKGSPYPRGYYRCSSSKGCLARKQVERNRSDPKMFIVTYTSEHNHPMPTHRNSLAGSTRQKPVNASETPPEQPSCSSPSAAGLSPLTERLEVKTEGDEDMGGIYDLLINDDFYVGFEQLDGGSDDSDCFSEQFSPSSEFPWLSNGSSTATAAGGS
ncbi:hypothetical protein KSS87_010472 [Heliosperma pusillum]|nr:hypothetical protein KSS87_010472 [Heliosperma pusillum]